MRRFVLAALALLVLITPCLAAETVALNDASAAAGQTLYLTVTLESPVKANTVGITCQFDKTLLEAQPALSSWAVKGMLSAFEPDNMGAWATTAETELKGKLCVLAFRIKDGAAFHETQVECALKFKTDAKEVGQYTCKATVSCACDHRYGDWKSTGGMAHERVCSLCGGKNTQTHDWDDGTERKQENGTVIITKTCLVCKEQIKTDMPAGSETDQLIQPGVAPDTEPSQGGNTAAPEQEDQSGVEVIIGEDGSIINKDTGAVIVPGKAQDLGPATDGHDHEEVLTTGAADDHDHTPGGESPVTLWVILGVLAVAVAAGVVFLKRR